MNYQATNNQKQQLLKTKASHFSAKAYKFRANMAKSICVLAGMAFLAYAFATWQSSENIFSEFSAISAVIAALALFSLPFLLPKQSATKQWQIRLEKWGGLETVLHEIHSHVNNGSPVYFVQAKWKYLIPKRWYGHVYVYEKGIFHIAGNWWIKVVDNKNACEIVNIGEIAAIKHDPDGRVIIILTDGSISLATFGQNLEEIFGLFSAINPHILRVDDTITLPESLYSTKFSSKEYAN